MKPSNAVLWLAGLLAVLALIAAGAGLFWPVAGAPHAFTSLHGDVVDVYGHGVYATDSVMKSGATRGADVVTIVLAIPLLVGALARYRRGSTRGALLLAGALTFFLYVCATNAMSVAYNGLFLLYVAIFSLSFFAWFSMITAIQPIAARFPASLPYRGLATFLLLCGLLTGFVWLEPMVGALLRGMQPDLLDHYTTMVTEALDLALIVPSCFLAGVMLWRRDPRGLGVAVPLLVLLLLVGPAVAAMTWFQVADGIVFTLPQMVGPIGGFLVLGIVDIWVLVIVLRATPREVTGDREGVTGNA